MVPLTTAEQALAEREPERLVELLRAACALSADPHRACLVDVLTPPPAARTRLPSSR